MDVRPFEDPNHNPSLRAHLEGLASQQEHGAAHEGLDFMGDSYSCQQEERDRILPQKRTA